MPKCISHKLPNCVFRRQMAMVEHGVGLPVTNVSFNMQKGLVTGRPRLISHAQKVARIVSSIIHSLSPTLAVRLGRLRSQIFGSSPAIREAWIRTNGSLDPRGRTSPAHGSHFIHGRTKNNHSAFACYSTLWSGRGTS